MNTAKIKLLVGGVLILGGLGTLGYMAADANASFALDVKQYLESPEKYSHRGLRLAGRATADSWVQDGNVHTFRVEDLTDSSRVVPVRYVGTVPDTFEEGANVIVEGKMDEGGTLQATLVMAQCPSKYESVKTEEDLRRITHDKPMAER